ncbi:MAG: D-hexose-6-phosphate mutarotase [Pleurocapsa sp. CRU_1_2]|nr:D-hexose-6-phosphate mutarotase [Pleurocapsa sp. CRU_1_2]
MNIEQLNANYGIADKVKFVEGQGNFPLIKINNEHAEATISVYAGQVLSFKPVGQVEDLMFLSSQAYYQTGKAIKGGTPICWPWFGPDPEGKGRASHGFVRDRLWQVRDVVSTQDGATQVTMGLVDTSETRAIWNYSFDFSVMITVGKVLKITLVTRNTGSESFAITQALHTYFKIGDINQVTVLGLENKAYIDKVDRGQQKNQSGAITFSGECDRIYLDVPAQLAINDRALNRQITVTATNSKTAIVWNPGADISAKMADLGDRDYENFVCVETANAADEVITVPAGEQYQIAAQYAVV